MMQVQEEDSKEPFLIDKCSHSMLKCTYLRMMKEQDRKKGLKEEKMKELVKEEGGQVRLSKVGSLNLSQMLPTYKKIKSVE